MLDYYLCLHIIGKDIIYIFDNYIVKFTWCLDSREFSVKIEILIYV